MEREPQRQEKENKKPPAVLILCQHTPENAPTNSAFLKSVLEQQLQRSPSGKVLVVVEDAWRPSTLAETIEKLVEKGIPPLEACTAATFYQTKGRIPRTAKEFIDFREKLSKSGDPDIQTSIQELQTLGEIFIKYPGRLGLVWEGVPEETLIKESDEFKISVENMKKAHKLVRQGRFDQALSYFKKATTNFAQGMSIRERRIEEKISKFAKENQVAGIVGCLGAGHTHLAHFLESSEFAVKMLFPQKEKGEAFRYDPGAVITRALRFFPGKEITELEWFKGLLSDALFGIFRILGIPYQEANRRIFRTLSKNFPDLASIRKFESQIRERGFWETCKNL